MASFSSGADMSAITNQLNTLRLPAGCCNTGNCITSIEPSRSDNFPDLVIACFKRCDQRSDVSLSLERWRLLPLREPSKMFFNHASFETPRTPARPVAPLAHASRIPRLGILVPNFVEDSRCQVSQDRTALQSSIARS